jgi:hypothetical protein
MIERKCANLEKEILKKRHFFCKHLAQFKGKIEFVKFSKTPEISPGINATLQAPKKSPTRINLTKNFLCFKYDLGLK